MKNVAEVAGVAGRDPMLPDVELVVDGKSYQLVYDFNAVVLADEATGMNLLECVVGRMQAKSLRGLLWAALLYAQPEMTIEEAGKLIRPYNLVAVRQAIVTTWFGSVSDADGTEGEAPESPEK